MRELKISLIDFRISLMLLKDLTRLILVELVRKMLKSLPRS